MCDNFGIKHLTTGAWNPQANEILERIHQGLGNYLQTFDLDVAGLNEESPWDEYLAATAFAVASEKPIARFKKIATPKRGHNATP